MKRMMMGVVFAVLAAMWLAACGDDTQSVQEAEEEAARIAAEAEASATRQLGIELADAMRTARTAAQAYVREDGAQQERSGTRVTEAIAKWIASAQDGTPAVVVPSLPTLTAPVLRVHV